MVKNNNFVSFLVARDMYGYAIGINYRGSDKYQTKVGSLCTLATYIAVLFNAVLLFTVFTDGSRQDETTRS